MLVSLFDFSPWEAEAGGSQVQAQPELQSELVQSQFGQLKETLSQNSEKE